MNSVLDEIGIDLNSTLLHAPGAKTAQPVQQVGLMCCVIPKGGGRLGCSGAGLPQLQTRCAGGASPMREQPPAPQHAVAQTTSGRQGRILSMSACGISLCDAMCTQEAMPQAIGESAGGGGLPSPPRGGPPPGGTCVTCKCRSVPGSMYAAGVLHSNVGLVGQNNGGFLSWLLDCWIWTSFPSRV